MEDLIINEIEVSLQGPNAGKNFFVYLYQFWWGCSGLILIHRPNKQTILCELSVWQLIRLIFRFWVVIVRSLRNIVPFIFYGYAIVVYSIMIRCVCSL